MIYTFPAQSGDKSDIIVLLWLETFFERNLKGYCLWPNSAYQWYINSAHDTLNRDDGGLLPNAYLHSLIDNVISDFVIVYIWDLSSQRSPLMNTVDRSVETLGHEQ